MISACYAERETAITAAMAALIDGTGETLLTPDKIILTKQMCRDYIDSCNGMFGDDVIAKYIESQTNTDTLAACRAVAQQCFDDFGGTNYENFYAPNSGLFVPNIVDTTDARKTALDWFTLYSYGQDGSRLPGYRSICAQRVADIASCADQIEEVFGGLDMVVAHRLSMGESEFGRYKYVAPQNDTQNINAYGWAQRDAEGSINWSNTTYKFKNRRLRPTGVATEVYNQIIDSLITQCTNVDGRFVEAQFIDHRIYGRLSHSSCELHWQEFEALFGREIGDNYGSVDTFENICPKNYISNTDTNAWGACLCWENGGRRSKNGFFGKCVTGIPLTPPQGSQEHPANDAACSDYEDYIIGNTNPTIQDWCTSTVNSNTNQVCPFGSQNENCTVPDGVPDGILN